MVFAELWNHRRYIVVNALNDLRSRYVGTSLGWIWTVLPTLALIAIYGVVFSGVMPVRLAGEAPGGPTAFFLYLAAGLLPWVSFSESLMRGTGSLVEAAPYLKRLPIGEPVFVAKTVMTSFFGLLIAIGLLCAVASAIGHSPGPAWLFLPVVAALLTVFAFGLSCALAALHVLFRDVGQAMGIVLQIWMWLVPVVYVGSIVPTALSDTFPYNPIYPFLKASRDSFLEYRPPSIALWGAMLGWSVAALVAGSIVIKRLSGDLRDAL
jgi:lipopolysaccharide transport system permease protein